MITRRDVLSGALALSAAGLPASGLLPGSAARAADVGVLRIASVRFGTLSWLLETIRAEGLDAKAGLKLDVLEVATNQAGPIALLSGDCDVMVSDWPWAMRQRALGEMVKFSPFTSALGAVMVPKGSAVTSLKDLEGRKLGVAGSAIDKSWLLLRAYSQKTLGKDLATSASPLFAAPPLVSEELLAGRVDAVLTFWPFAARLKGAGHSELLGMAEIMKALGIQPVAPLVGYIWREKTEAAKGPAIAALLAAATAANAVLASSDAAWERLRPLVKPKDDAEFAAVKAYYRSGIPGPWTAAETASAEKLMQLLAASGDKDLMGDGTRFDAKLFHIAG